MIHVTIICLWWTRDAYVVSALGWLRNCVVELHHTLPLAEGNVRQYLHSNIRFTPADMIAVGTLFSCSALNREMYTVACVVYSFPLHCYSSLPMTHNCWWVAGWWKSVRKSTSSPLSTCTLTSCKSSSSSWLLPVTDETAHHLEKCVSCIFSNISLSLAEFSLNMASFVHLDFDYGVGPLPLIMLDTFFAFTYFTYCCCCSMISLSMNTTILGALNSIFGL